jgi:hypothetical protein
MFWPTPYPMTTALHLGKTTGSRLELPVVSLSNQGSRTAFLEPEESPKLEGYRSLPSETVSDYAEIKEVLRDERKRTTSVTATNSGGAEYPWGTMHYTEEIVHKASDDQPEAASVKSIYTITAELAKRTLKWEGLLDFSSDRDNFYYRYTRRLLQNGALLREKHWKETIPRDHQ